MGGETAKIALNPRAAGVRRGARLMDR